MSDPLEFQEFCRAANLEREVVARAFGGRRFRDSGEVLVVAHGVAAFLGDLAGVVAKPGYLDDLIEALISTTRLNAAAKMSQAATTQEVGHG